MKPKLKKNEKGLTLVEMLVGLFIFSLVFGSISTLFVSGIRNQRRALAKQEILSQTSYLMEYMGRAIRMAKKDDIDGVHCLTGEKVNYERIFSSGIPIGLMFRNYKDECQSFFLDLTTRRLKESKNGAAPIALTSNDLRVNSFNIAESGWGQGDVLQPRVIMFLEIENVGPLPQPRIRIQTTISQRNPDIPY